MLFLCILSTVIIAILMAVDSFDVIKNRKAKIIMNIIFIILVLFVIVSIIVSSSNSDLANLNN